MTRALALICVGVAAAASGAQWQTPPTHPRLFIRLDEVAALRVRCGVPGTPAGGGVRGFGLYHDDFKRLEAVAEEMLRAPAGFDDLFVPAMLHLITGQPGKSDRYTEYVALTLTDPARERIGIDGLVALDWCWEALSRRTRGRVLDRLTSQIEPLEAQHSPLDHFEFIRRLEGMAAAIVLSEAECREHDPLLGKLAVARTAALRYFSEFFPRFCRERGTMPTSPTHGIQEEADIVLACELWRSATGENLLAELRDSAGRMLEHYFYADSEHPALPHGFIHDDGTTIPQRPASVYTGFAPAVPFVLARYAGDPVAAWYAMRALPLASGGPDPGDRYLWVRLLYGAEDLRPAPRKAMPLGRNLGGGWVAMRSGWSPGETVLLFDAGQPFWRSRQHYDAGQFQIYRKGRLAIDSGDDVAWQAAMDQHGRTLIAGESGDWEHFAQATIAHNCITVVDPHFQQEQYGQLWHAVGNQRIIEGNYVPGDGPIARTPRWTGALTAFETNSFYSYAAADLTPAYPKETVRSATRQIVFVNAGAVVVLDRVEAVKPNSIRTWHLQLPTRPALLTAGVSREAAAGAVEDSAASGPEAQGGNEGANAGGTRGSAALLNVSPTIASAGGGVRVIPMGARQLHGRDESGGIWELDPEHTWVSVTHGEGRLFAATLLPADAQRRLVGGPMRRATITGGPMAGQTYVGGERFGYEYRLWPAHFLKAPSAAYELGSPVGLGPQFGVGAAWGRYDVTDVRPETQVTFLHVLIPTDANVAAPPPVAFEMKDATARIEITFDDQRAAVQLSLKDATGQVSIRNPLTGGVLFEKELARQVEE